MNDTKSDIVENHITENQEKATSNPTIEKSGSPSSDSRVYNIQNLKQYGRDIKPLSHEEAMKRGSIGGKKSGEARKARKTMKETMLAMLSMELSEEKLKAMGVDTSTLNGDYTVQGAIISSMIREAINGDTKSMQLLRDTIGEKPIDESINHTEIVTADDVALIENMKKALIG